MLHEVPIFSGLSDEELQALKTHAITKSYKKNTIVIDRGDETDSLYLIIDGRVKVYMADEDGKEIVVNTQGPGEYFGELAALGDLPRTASVTTLEPCKFMVLSKETFLACITKHPTIAMALIRELVSRISALTETVKSLALDDVYGRLRFFLYDQAQEQGGQLLTEAMTQQEIANRIGAGREMVSRILSDLKSGGYLAIERKRVVLLKDLPARY
jgi:CRP/FNR family cyclic AMP-dependent transcriptional regulator